MEQFPKLCWPDWEIVELIGTGSYGRVYKIKREENGHVYYDALKVIKIPKSASEIEELLNSGMDRENITEYFKGHANKIFREIDTMIQLGGVTNIVGYKDHKMIDREDGIGCEIFIRMELLTPLSKYLLTNKLTPEMVVRMGIDLCRALEICEKKNIIHRDIKPANIFVSDYGDFELGDFGIARVATDATIGTVAGTYSYMAPEIYFNRSYTSSVDLYSLGLVLYQYLNSGRLPFMPPLPEKIQPGDMEKALSVRMSGKKPIPALRSVPGILSNTVCRACCFSPAQRFQSVSEFKSALEQCLQVLRNPQTAAAGAQVPPGNPQTPPTGAQVPPKRPQTPPTGAQVQSQYGSPRTNAVPPKQTTKKKKSKTWGFILLLIALLGGGAAYYTSTLNSDHASDFSASNTENEDTRNEDTDNDTDRNSDRDTAAVTALYFYSNQVSRENDGTLWLAEGQEVPFSAWAEYTNGDSNDRNILFTSTNYSVANISKATGTITATGEGETTLTASCGGLTKTIDLVVYPVNGGGTIETEYSYYDINGLDPEIIVDITDSSISYYTAIAYFDTDYLSLSWGGWESYDNGKPYNTCNFTQKKELDKEILVTIYLYSSDSTGNYDIATDLIDYCQIVIK